MAETNSERERRILESAARLIAHFGYDKTTVDEIAREAGVSKGAIYLHFKSKEDLFDALLMRESETITERFYELIDADTGGITVFNIYRYSLVVMDESPLLKAIYMRDKRVLGDWVHRVRDTPAYTQALNVSVEFVRHFQEAGLIRRDLDAEAVMVLLMALRYGLLAVDDITPEGQKAPTISELGPTLAEMLSSGLAPREGEADQEAGRQALQQLTNIRLKFMEQRKHE
ncbi:MAG: helix-turn-helix domain-containing protein [Chloroflexota bacterium]